MAAKNPEESQGPAPRRDAELVLAARRGDKRAFVEIVAHNQAMVCGIAYGILGDFGESEDAGQETFVTAWRKIAELREPERLRPWLAQIARNTALGLRRKKRPHETWNEQTELPDRSPRPDEAAVTEDEAVLVREILERLPENYRLPLILYYREGQSVAAVAETLELTEEAVKQRLARGRELCRDRLSDVVERVLSRTRPNATFTIAVAVALGALAAPTVVAGAAFSAAATGATSGSSAAAPLITAMSTTKAAFVTAVVVATLCVPLGYHLNLGGTHASTQFNPASGPAKVTGAGLKLDFEGSVLFAEWRDLHFRFGTNADSMPMLHKAIWDIKDPFHRQALRATLMAEWAEVDPQGGLRFFLAKASNAPEGPQFLEEWLARDAQSAIDSLLQSSGPGWVDLLGENLKTIARLQPERMAEIVSRLPKPQSYWDKSVRDAFAIAAERGLDAAIRAADSVTGPNRGEALAGVAQTWGKQDLQAAIGWAKGLPGEVDRDELIRASLIGIASQNPAAALDLVGLVPSGGRHAYFGTTTGARILAEASRADFEGTTAWLTANPGRLNRDDLEGLAQVVTEKLNADPIGFLAEQMARGSLPALIPALSSALLNAASGQRKTVWEWLKGQPVSEEIKTLQVDVLNSAGYQDPGLAFQLVADLPQNQQGEAQLEKLARALLNGGSMLHRLDQLLATAPERLKQPLLKAAFMDLRQDSVVEPELWTTRIAMLPESAQTSAIESLGRVWGAQAPEDAVQWALGLSHTHGQAKAIAAITSSWAREDSHSAAAWLTSLPAGTPRDEGINSLVMAVSGKYPREAWDWALSIGDDAMRAKAAQEVAWQVAKRDPITAQLWIESSAFSPERKLQLQESLPKQAAR